MDQNKKKELQAQYKAMHHEMGVVSFKCAATGEAYLACSRNTKSTLNSTRFQLEAGNHPNKALQALWKQTAPPDSNAPCWRCWTTITRTRIIPAFWKKCARHIWMRIQKS